MTNKTQDELPSVTLTGEKYAQALVNFAELVKIKQKHEDLEAKINIYITRLRNGITTSNVLDEWGIENVNLIIEMLEDLLK